MKEAIWQWYSSYLQLWFKLVGAASWITLMALMFYGPSQWRAILFQTLAVSMVIVLCVAIGWTIGDIVRTVLRDYAAFGGRSHD